jgi:hypothetical protein
MSEATKRMFAILYVLACCIVLYGLIEMSLGPSPWLVKAQTQKAEAEARAMAARVAAIEAEAAAEIDRAAARAVRRDTDTVTFYQAKDALGAWIDRVINLALMGLIAYLIRKQNGTPNPH